jgi:hypothetical protein
MLQTPRKVTDALRRTRAKDNLIRASGVEELCTCLLGVSQAALGAFRHVFGTHLLVCVDKIVGDSVDGILEDLGAAGVVAEDEVWVGFESGEVGADLVVIEFVAHGSLGNFGMEVVFWTTVVYVRRYIVRRSEVTLRPSSLL